MNYNCNCNCAILFLDNKKYLVKCPNCKNKIDENKIDENIIDENDISTIYKFRWYEKHIVLMRDNPHLRTGIELLLLIGWIVLLIVCWIEWLKIVNLVGNFGHKIIGIGFTIWIVFLFGYLDSWQKLCQNPRFFL